ncbi:MAG: hypothetical protein ACLR5N_02805 [Haemophilus parainfluenzae]
MNSLKLRLSFVAKSGEITRWLNYICAALLFVVLAIFYGKIHFITQATS